MSDSADTQKQEVVWSIEIMQFFSNVGHLAVRILGFFLNIILTVLLVLFIAGVITGSVFALYIKNYVDPHFDASYYPVAGTNTTSTIYYYEYDTPEDRANRNGTPVEYQRIYATEDSEWVSYQDMIQIDENGNEHTYLVDAFVSIEDHRFWSHQGVDWIRTISAASGYLTGSSSFGGSTITQQLIKNLTGNDEVKITRKIQEILQALDLSKKKSREEILEMYLNIVFLGNHCTGVQSAARNYFGKSVSELTLEECAALASIVQNPSAYEPRYHDIVYVPLYDEDGNAVKDEDGKQVYVQKVDTKDQPVFDDEGNPVFEEKGNRKRRRYVLGEMLNYGAITYDEYLTAYGTELSVLMDDSGDRELKESEIFSWYTEAVFNSVADALMERFGYDQLTAQKLIYNGGLKIYVPMDLEIQETMEKVFEDPKNEDYFLMSARADAELPQYSMVVMDPYTGDVLGLVGGTGEKVGNRLSNRATDSQRPVGSSIKPLAVYTPALEAGLITCGTVYDDTPFTFYVNGEQDKDGNDVAPNPWPKNYELNNLGLTTVTAALKRSCNTVSVKILADYGVERSFSFLHDKLHIESILESQEKGGKVYSDLGLAPLGLGQLTYGATNLEMTAAYCIFANGGVYNSPNLWLEIYDSQDNLILSNDTESEIVISENTADLMTIMMQQVINGGTASKNTLPLQKEIDCAGKTGTTDSDYDRWFMGYTPYYVAGSWVGYDMPMVLGTGNEGFQYAPTLKVWNTVMTMIHQKYINDAKTGGEPLRTFSYKTNQNLVECTVCLDSGLLMSDACYADPRGNRSATYYYVRGTEPTEKCTCHQFVYVEDPAVGGVVPTLAVYTGDPESLTQVGLITVDRQFPMELAVTDAQYVYMPLIEGIMPSFEDGKPFFYTNFEELKKRLYPTADPSLIDPTPVVDPTEEPKIVLEKFIFGGISGTTNTKTGVIKVKTPQYNCLGQNCRDIILWANLLSQYNQEPPYQPIEE